ncbi:hypothetical protein [Hymenobacter glacieicola]|uniref:Uncharacterized protein n=1 Tax=Hymenobacter glacieicola TaxID=1562124 RepID=A0ABQ1WPJ0_9BACT|nr:hypothetical protein [Hymenobacter glacieicola]GGG37043.1 hypothetical protein GCM10011378_11710 [Hymenobacter glacieicola]
MFTSVLRLCLVFFALSFCLPTESSATALRGRGLLPAVRAKLKGQHHLHRPNYRPYRANRHF